MTGLKDEERANLGTRYEALRIISERLDSSIYDMQESESREEQIANLRWLESEDWDLVVVMDGVRGALATDLVIGG